MSTMRRYVLGLALGAALVAGGTRASADASGVVTGHVYDQAGSPLRGIRVDAKLKPPGKLVKSAYTNEEGAFRITGLEAGDYRVIASAPKLRTIAQDVKIQVGAPAAEVNLIMEVNLTEVEEVKVVEKAPTVSTRSKHVKEVYDLDFVESMPHTSRDEIFRQMVGTISGGGVRGQAAQGRAPTPSGPPVRFNPHFNTESYAHIGDNPFLASRDNPLSTFSIDVDTASYANIRRFIQGGSLPPADAVRIEELVNYFPFSYPPPATTGREPLAVTFEVNDCPWNADSRLVRIGLRGKDVPLARRPASNLVFLVDVSGSMTDENKLPLVKQSLRLLVEALAPADRVAMVVYAGSSGLVLPSTPATERARILEAIDRLESGGSTNGGQGIQLAYQVATKNFIARGNNRVLLATDGDFNVGVTSQGDLVRLIEDKAKSGVFLTVLGYGMGNLKDATMEQLADKGNGNYAYIDSPAEARKVLVEQLTGTLLTVAKDVKIQVEFNPAQVLVYRLIGYENRVLRKEDFNDDQKDAGEIGAGHTVTALYEIVAPSRARDRAAATPPVDPLRYQRPAQPGADSAELLTVKARYKLPDGWFSKKLEWQVTDMGAHLPQASADFRFAAAVAAFGMVLRRSPHAGTADHDLVLRLAADALGEDRGGHRRAFLDLVRQARALSPAAAVSHR